MIMRATSGVLECANQEDSDHQQQIALAVLTRQGADRAGSVTELKTHRPQPRERRGQKRRSRQEDPWAGTGMDEDEETLPREPDAGKDAGGESSLGQDQEGRRPPVDDWALEENLALRMRWGLSPECSEPRPLQTKLRIADEILTFLAEAALEIEQIDKAVAAMGIAQNLKDEENVIVARGESADRLHVQVQRLLSNHTRPLEACQNRLARRLFAMTRRNWDSEPKNRQIPNKDLHRELGMVPSAMELRIRCLGCAKSWQRLRSRHVWTSIRA